jgi:DNA-binding beta-propeller fold protein YncE
MRPLFLSSALLLLGACSAATEPRPPPQNRFVYPSGIAHRDLPDVPEGTSNGALYVVSANFDRCFDTGSVIAVNLDTVGLPAFGSPVSLQGPQQLTNLSVADDAWVQIDSFGGELALWSPPGGTPRLFVPSRAEGSFLHVIDIDGATTLRCARGGGNNCIDGALSLISVPGQVEDQPRAQAPIGVTVSPDAAEAWVTHTEVADSPARTGQNPQTYVVRVPTDSLSLDATNFLPVGGGLLDFGGTHAAAVGSRYVYVTGRNYTVLQGQLQPAEFLVRLVDRRNPGRVLDPSLEVAINTLEARSLALSPDETRLYVVARSPDTLLVVDLVGTQTDVPGLTVVEAVPLPDGATDVTVIPRISTAGGPPRGDLVAVTCSGAGVVAIFDEEVGQVVAQVSGVGVQPAELAVDQRGNAARLYSTNFGDGRIAVIDIPNLDNPQDARLVAHLGTIQVFDPDQGTTVCQERQQ